MRLSAIALATLAVGTFASTAHALKAPGALEGEHGLVVATGAPARIARLSTATVPPRTRAAWAAFSAAYGPELRASFDAVTGVPMRIWGLSVPAPGSVASAVIAERTARTVLARHVALLAPGASVDALELAANHVAAGLRTVTFVQRAGALPVLGGQVSFRFKNDRLFVVGSEALPDVALEPVRAPISAKAAESAALRWLKSETGASATVESVSSAMVLPIVRATGATYHTVVEVTARSTSPIGLWSIYVDQVSGLPVARRQRLMFADGTVRINVPERWPGAARVDAPASRINVGVAGTTLTADEAGLVTWASDGPVDVTMRAQGPLVRVVNNASQAQISTSFTLDPAGTYVWDRRSNEVEDAQLTTYVASYVAKARSKVIAPEMRWLDSNQLEANVNMADNCNAYSDGNTINFFRAGSGCENTGRLPDVIYHEFGHAFHFHAIINGAGTFDTSLSEGAADYLAATITNDNGMGRGFFFNNDALRDIDPAGREARWPDDIAQDPHETGLIIAGALWDLRKAMVAAHGEAQGVALTDRLLFEILQRAADIPTTYVEALAADDDDGDLANGTPNICAINDAFARHGLADASSAGPGVRSPTTDGLTITLPVQRNNDCPGSEITGVNVSWQLRASPSTSGTLALAPDAAGYVGTLPTQRPGEVVRYQVTVTLGSGETITYPDNLADPMYELFVGEVTPIYCTGFEGDPASEGWSHQLLAGQASQGADDWMFGPPQGTTGSGDPSSAWGGTNVAGNDLGGGNFNGLYQPGKTNVLVSPTIEISGFQNVRLQYRRWLNVEDGFYDRARIRSNDQEVWANTATDEQGRRPHQDKEWRFQDVDLSSTIQDGRVQVKFELSSDQGLELGGWTIDDFCIVGFGASCGDGNVSDGEQCDDGNLANGDGCENDCTTTPVPDPVCGNGLVEAGEICDDGNLVDGDGCEAACTATPPPTGPICGNGIVEAGEQCDDAKLDGTACTATCEVPAVTGGTLDEDAEGGCGCTAAAPTTKTPSALALLALGLALALRRRR
ncbi:DUF4215 domain-containing protein [Myxococcota bacterium]|nr:DUF4215 domain-containing protein [Myxococcota bacterium]